MTETDFADMEAALKRIVGVLDAAGVPFVLAGSLASWARGGPQSRHDLDLILREADAERALEAAAAAGLRTERPPEGWLFKAWDGDVLVDLIFGPSGTAVDDAMFERAETLSVLGLTVPVLSVEDLLVTKLCAITEHAIRFESLLGIVRALREQVPWDRVRERTAGSPFSRSFFVLCEDLGLT